MAYAPSPQIRPGPAMSAATEIPNLANTSSALLSIPASDPNVMFNRSINRLANIASCPVPGEAM